MAAAHFQALMAEQIEQHAATGKRVVQMQLVDLAHQSQILGGDRTRLVIDAAATDTQHFCLPLAGKIVLGIDHRSPRRTLSSPALVSAP
jgi:hypothetical protein